MMRPCLLSCGPLRCLVLCMLACGSDPVGGAGAGGTGAGAAPDAVMEDCTIPPGVYDEAWRALYDRRNEVLVDAAQASELVSPAEGAIIDATAGPITLRWTELGPAPRAKASPAPAPGTNAHGCTLDQDLYWMQLQVGARTLHVLNLDREWTITADVLGQILAGGGKVTVRLVRAPMVQDRVDAGPFRQPSDRSFQVR